MFICCLIVSYAYKHICWHIFEMPLGASLMVMLDVSNINEKGKNASTPTIKIHFWRKYVYTLTYPKIGFCFIVSSSAFLPVLRTSVGERTRPRVFELWNIQNKITIRHIWYAHCMCLSYMEKFKISLAVALCFPFNMYVCVCVCDWVSVCMCQ